MYEQNTSMMNTPERNTFLLPAMVEGDFSSDEIAEDADGLQMMSFQRVKIPAGGALQFEIPTEDPDNPDYARTLEGVILYNHSAYTLWPEGSEYDEDTKPLCSSVDGKTGIGEPGGACATCPMNAYGSARDGGRGKACKNMRDIYPPRSRKLVTDSLCCSTNSSAKENLCFRSSQSWSIVKTAARTCIQFFCPAITAPLLSTKIASASD